MYEYLKTTGEFSGYEITKEAINIAYKAGYSTKEVSDKDRKFWFNEMMRYKNEKKNK